MTYELKILCKNILLYSFWLCVVLICYHIRVDLTLIRTCHSQKSLEFNNYNTHHRHVLMQHLLCVCLKSRKRINSGRCPIPRCSNLDKQEISDIKLPRLIKKTEYLGASQDLVLWPKKFISWWTFLLAVFFLTT